MINKINSASVTAFLITLSTFAHGIEPKPIKKEVGTCTFLINGDPAKIVIPDLLFSTQVSDATSKSIELRKLGLNLNGNLTLSPKLMLKQAFDKVVTLAVLDISTKFTLDNGNLVYLTTRSKSTIVNPRGHIPTQAELFYSMTTPDDVPVGESFDIIVDCYLQKKNR